MLSHNYIGMRVMDMQRVMGCEIGGMKLGYTVDDLQWFYDTFLKVYGENLPCPFLYPVFGGAVQLEWLLGDYNVILRMDLGKRIGEWVERKKGEEGRESKRLDLRDISSWAWVVSRVKALGEVK